MRALFSQYRYLGFALVLLVFSSGKCRAQSNGDPDILEAEYWKNQGIEQVLVAWIQNGVDSVDGQFHAFLDRQWKSYRTTNKYPGMMSRHLFSFSVAYMLTGDESHLNKADELFRYLSNYGWDQRYGGWLYEIDREGQPVDTKKDLFMNIYAVAGLSLYYMATHNREAYTLIKQTRSLMHKHAWDEAHGGYFRRLNRRWKVTDSTKVFTPQVAPVSGYLLYLYLATRERHYLQEGQDLMALALNRMTDPETGWIREKFKSDWSDTEYSPEPEQINIGHNIEVAWMLLRLYQLTGKERYRNKAVELSNQLENHALKPNGAWLHRMELRNPEAYPENSPWWIQAYGNMLELYLHKITGDNRYLQHFSTGARFWNEAFLDEQFGATVLSSTLDGKIDRGDKAVRSKTSYHALEHAWLIYLYLRIWVEQGPVTLNFRIDKDSDNRPLCPLPIEIPDVQIDQVRIDGEIYLAGDYLASDGCIELPRGKTGIINIMME